MQAAPLLVGWWWRVPCPQGSQPVPPSGGLPLLLSLTSCGRSFFPDFCSHYGQHGRLSCVFYVKVKMILFANLFWSLRLIFLLCTPLLSKHRDTDYLCWSE